MARNKALVVNTTTAKTNGTPPTGEQKKKLKKRKKNGNFSKSDLGAPDGKKTNLSSEPSSATSKHIKRKRKKSLVRTEFSSSIGENKMSNPDVIKRKGMKFPSGVVKKRKWNEGNKPAREIPTTWGLPKLHSDGQTVKSTASSLLEGVADFNWDATAKDWHKFIVQPSTDLDSDDDEEEKVTKRKKLTPAEKRAKTLEEERNMKKKEKELLESEENPQSPDHFERLLVGNPNSAQLWIKYMGFHAINADIEKARVVARRALKRIDSQLVSHKLDVWIALLNLDFTFNPPEVFKETFLEALKCNDDYAINSRALALYTDSKNVTEVDQLTNVMVKKYKTNLQNWLHCQNALMSVGLKEKARQLLQKALNVLTKKEHVTLISRFALLENKHGHPEQAQALFENLMTTFPQRLDLLSVYVNMLVKSNLIDLARSVLSRAASNTLPVRKMKSVYLKWIAFEEAHGTPADVEKVEAAAEKYVNRVTPRHDGSVKKEKGDISIKREHSEQDDDIADDQFDFESDD